MEMHDLLGKPIFNNNKKMLKETSKDGANDVYMTEATLEVIDFDEVKNEYIKGLQLKNVPTSNDVLYLSAEGILYFIEFKNGDMGKSIHNVKQKIFDSLLIFTDIIEKGISFTRKKMRYVLVYNEERSGEFIARKKDKLEKDEVQASKGFAFIQSSVSGLGNYNIDPFGLKKQFKGLYFQDVYTYTQDEFERAFVGKIKQNA